MKKKLITYLITILLLTIYHPIVYAWDHSIELGYGYSHDPNHTKYHNSGIFLNSDLLTFCQTCWTLWSINAALGHWYNSAPTHRYLTSGALSLGLRVYPYTNNTSYPFYVFGLAGPAYISSPQFGLNKQAGNLTLQWNLGLGTEIQCFDINLRFVHFSNAYLAKPDHGFSILYTLSIGYLF